MGLGILKEKKHLTSTNRTSSHIHIRSRAHAQTNTQAHWQCQCMLMQVNFLHYSLSLSCIIEGCLSAKVSNLITVSLKVTLSSVSTATTGSWVADGTEWQEHTAQSTQENHTPTETRAVTHTVWVSHTHTHTSWSSRRPFSSSRR